VGAAAAELAAGGCERREVSQLEPSTVTR
jgi:hypothetical protein